MRPMRSWASFWKRRSRLVNEDKESGVVLAHSANLTGSKSLTMSQEQICPLFLTPFQSLWTKISAMADEFRRTHISASHQLLRGTAVDNPPDAPASPHHRVISANTPQPRYSRV
jgi:hypothetical protein